MDFETHVYSVNGCAEGACGHPNSPSKLHCRPSVPDSLVHDEVYEQTVVKLGRRGRKGIRTPQNLPIPGGPTVPGTRWLVTEGMEQNGVGQAG